MSSLLLQSIIGVSILAIYAGVLYSEEIKSIKKVPKSTKTQQNKHIKSVTKHKGKQVKSVTN